MSEEATAERLIEWLASVKNDPYAFVMGAFPWGEVGTSLENAAPDVWQIDILQEIRDGLLDLNTAIKIAVASGHGIGKSALVSWIVLWGFSTFPDTRGRVTAGTEAQLKTTTWAEMGKWFNLFIAKDHFQLTATALLSRDPDRERTWRIDMIAWSEKNPQAFAGMHNQGKRIIYIFDEGSTIYDIIYETAEGAMTDKDTQIIWAVFGNPTKNAGRFKEIFPGGAFHRGWRCRHIDSRDVEITNKSDIQAKIDTYGEDSDYVRIRVKGTFPRIGEMEFFSSADIDLAATREAAAHYTDPLALGVDVARYGKNSSVIYLRKGRDARTFERQRFQGLSTVQLADKVAEVNATYDADGIMVDGGGVGGGVVDNIRQKQLYCFEVQFGSKDDTPHAVFGSNGEHYANKRSGMYGAARAWLKTGAIPNDPDLLMQFRSIKYVFNNKNEIQLLSKEDLTDAKINPGLAAVGLDDIDAFVLTFAHALERHERAGGEGLRRPAVESEYDPFDPKRMEAT